MDRLVRHIRIVSNITGRIREPVAVRFSSLQKLFPEEAEALFEKTERDAMERRQNYVRLQKSFDMEIKERKEKEAAEKAEK